jgi:ABC-type transport system involved in multi-copper enzyme maturation permease subunit
MLNRLYGIAVNTFLETIRQPIYGVVLVLTALLMLLNVGLAAYTLEDDDKLLLDLGLSTLLLSGMFLAAFSAAGVLSREIENKTALTVISKPVSRPVFFLGKFLGLAAAMIVAMYLNFLVFVLIVRHGVLQTSSTPWDLPAILFGTGGLLAALGIAAYLNYVHGREFMSMAVGLSVPLITLGVLLMGFFDRTWTLQKYTIGIIDKQVGVAALLVVLAVLVLSAVALTASTRLKQGMTLLICVVVLAVGSISDHLIGQYTGNSVVLKAIYGLIPNFSVLYVADPIADQVKVPLGYVMQAGAYALLVMTGVLMLGVALFQRREVG